MKWHNTSATGRGKELVMCSCCGYSPEHVLRFLVATVYGRKCRCLRHDAVATPMRSRTGTCSSPSTRPRTRTRLPGP